MRSGTGSRVNDSMPIHSEHRLLPYTSEQLFDLVADVEGYPEFLPWWAEARVRRREGDVYYTEQVVRFRILRQRFSSRTVLKRPECIDVTSTGGPLRHLDMRWTFRPAPGGGCRVHLDVDFELRSRLLGTLVGVLFAEAVRRIVAAFEERAHQLYGLPAGASAEIRPGLDGTETH